MKKDALLKELAGIREELGRCEALQWSRTACPREAIEATARAAELKVRADEIERRIAEDGR
jgi:flavoprotein